MKRPVAFAFIVAFAVTATSLHADDSFGVNLLRPDSLVGWDHSPTPPAGWTIDRGYLAGQGSSTPLLSGWTFGDFELHLTWSSAGGQWKIALPEVPDGKGLELRLAEGDHCGRLLDGPQELAPGAKIRALSAKTHAAVLVRQGKTLSLWVDMERLFAVPIAPQRRFGLGLAIEGGAATLSDIRLREPAGDSLFNGQDLAGWWTPGDLSVWQARDGMIAWVKTQKGGEYLRSEQEYANFTFSCEYKTAQETNSGIGIRTPRRGWPSGDGMELQIWDKPLNTPIDKQQTMAIYGNVPPLVRADKPGAWNRVVVKADGYMISAWMNGALVQQFNTFHHPELKWRNLHGWIGFQDHGGAVQFRNIRVLTAPDGLGLDAWYEPHPARATAAMIDRLMNSGRVAVNDGITSGAVNVKLGKPQREVAPPPAAQPKNDGKKKEAAKKPAVPAKTVIAPAAPAAPKSDFVLAELKGPGAVVRIARGNRDGNLACYFDGESKPRLVCATADLGKSVPELAEDENPVITCLTYRQSLKIVLQGATGAEYRIDYVTFPAKYALESFAGGESGFPRGWLSSTQYRLLQQSGGTVRQYDPLPRVASEKTTLAPGEAEPLISIPGTGIVHWLKLEGAKQLLANNDLWLEVHVDGAPVPSIAAPARFWFPGLAGPGNWHNYVMTERGGRLFRLGMPFGHGIVVSARNAGNRTIEDVALSSSVQMATEGTLADIRGRMRLHGVFTSGAAQLAELRTTGRLVGLVYEQLAGKPTGIESLTIDGTPRDGWKAPDLDAFLGFLGPNERRALSGRNGRLAWRYLMLDSVDCRESLVLEATAAKLGDRLFWYYAKVKPLTADR